MVGSDRIAYRSATANFLTCCSFPFVSFISDGGIDVLIDGLDKLTDGFGNTDSLSIADDWSEPASSIIQELDDFLDHELA